MSQAELKDHDDVCPICLTKMRGARRTFCGHMFHPLCLARALHSAPTCPLCKRTIS